MIQNAFDDVKGKVAVMTGGTGVIGTALARSMAAAGIRLVICGRSKEKSSRIADEIMKVAGGEVHGEGFDVQDREAMERAKEDINSMLGPVDFLINGAGGNQPSATTALENLTPDTIGDLSKSFFGLDVGGFDTVFKLNFNGTLIPTMVFARDMIGRGGSILNISSMSADRPLTKVPAYGAAKSAVDNLTQWLAVHFAPVGIRVNAISPGFFLTEQNRFLLTDEKTGEYTARARKIIANTPMGRFGEVDELTGAALFLLSQQSRFITGVVLPVDGGFSAYSGV